MVIKGVTLCHWLSGYCVFKDRSAFTSSSVGKRLWWSGGSVLPLSTQVCGFKPGRSRQDFSG